jgi:hypothetical protein
LEPAGDPAGGAGTGAGQAFYTNPLAVLSRRDPALLAHYDLAAATSPYAPHGLPIPPAGAAFQAAGAGPGATTGYADLLFAAFAPAPITVTAAGGAPAQIALAPGLTRYQTAPGAIAGGPVDLHLAAGAGPAPVLLGVDVYAAGAVAAPGGQSQLLTDTLILDLVPSSADSAAGTITTGWRVVPQHPGGGSLTLTLDIYQKPFGTHPNGHLGSWSLLLPAGGDSRSFTLTLHPVAKQATATLNGAGTPVFAWQGPPTTGDFAASLTLLAGDKLLVDLPVYDFTLDGGRVTDFNPAPGAVVLLPFGAR